MLPQLLKNSKSLLWVLPLVLPALLSAVQVDGGANACHAVVGLDARRRIVRVVVGLRIVRVVVGLNARRRGAGLA